MNDEKKEPLGLTPLQVIDALQSLPHETKDRALLVEGEKRRGLVISVTSIDTGGMIFPVIVVD